MKWVFVALFFFAFLSGCGQHVCPDEWIINAEPCVYENSPEECETPAREYFIVDGERAELEDFDVDWVKEHCALEPQIVE